MQDFPIERVEAVKEQPLTLPVDLTKANPAVLAALIELEPEIRWDTRFDEMRDAWEDMLLLPMTFRAGAAAPGSPRNIGELIRHTKPQAEWFIVLKDYTKQHSKHPTSTLPLRTVTALYYIAIILARTRCAATISHLSQEDLAKGVRWTLKQNWIGKSLQDELAMALRRLEPKDSC